MQILTQSDFEFVLSIVDWERLILLRYIAVLNDPKVENLEQLLAVMMQQQVDFVLESLVEEANIKLELNPSKTLIQRLREFWVGLS